MFNYGVCCGSLNSLAKLISEWSVTKGFETDWRNVPEKLMLVVTELSEAMEEWRHIDEKDLIELTTGTPQLASDWGKARIEDFSVEIADAIIRLLNLSASLGINIEAEIIAKMEKNEKRPYKHGKNC